MNHTSLIVGTLILAAAAVQGQDAFNPKSLPTGTVVRIVARKPPINLGRAEVLDCSSNLLYLRHNRDKFSIVPSNIMELAIVEKAPAPAASEAHPEGGADGQKESSDQTQGKKSLWERIKALWR
jgi:hypothetical protein